LVGRENMPSKNKFSVFKLLGVKYVLLLLYPVLLSSLLVSNSALTVYAQQQQQQQQNEQSTVNTICKLVQDNRIIAGFAGLDQAVDICNNLNSINSSQALSQLCSTISGLKIVNVDAFCNNKHQVNLNHYTKIMG
jgi:hypothetical protein